MIPKTLVVYLVIICAVLIGVFNSSRESVIDTQFERVEEKEKSVVGYGALSEIDLLVTTSEQRLPLLNLSSPTLIKNSSASRWGLLTKWSEEYLAEIRREEFLIMISDSPLFTYYDSSKPLGEFIERGIYGRGIPKMRFDKSTIKELILKNNNFKKDYRYLAPPIDFKEWIEDGDADGWQDLFSNVVEDSYSTVNLWLGKKGITSNTHMDEPHNFFLQVKGKKKFILSPPIEHTKLFLYPFTHPSSRQTQLFFDQNLHIKEIKSKNNLLSSIDGFEVILEPGDILYLPPFWFHHVITLEDSISLNFWSDSKEGAIRGTLEALPLPLEEDWTEGQKVTALIAFYKIVVAKVLPDRSQLFWNTLKSRYTLFFGALDPIDIYWEICSMSVTARHYSWIKEKEITYLSTDHHIAFVEELSPYETGIKELILSSYMENAFTLLFNPQKPNRIIQACT